MKRLYYRIRSNAIFAAGSMLVFFSACAGLEPRRGGWETVFITDDKSITLLPPASFGGELTIHQNLEGTYGEFAFSLETFVKVEEEEISFTAVTAFGTGAYDLLFRKTGIEYHSALAATVKPEYLVADFQLCYYPTAVVKVMVEKAGLIFGETEETGGWKRAIFDGKSLVIEIRRNGFELFYNNLLRHYEYHIKELPD